ncbi:MAG: lysylphosphatidylglycerol synthase transmembrane domain-containing protein [Clostridia bacterium]|nr:lysylphosphatidylglycerol synthase transmembrane domain-containing protein [Clostridia bacterium]MDD4685977.1 lysylphosphatidylglycerol synthase transmembrane domain-containing protein [Clostridia bacterium]
MKYSAKVYQKNKYLKYISGISKKGDFILYLYTAPKFLQKEIDEAEQAVAKQKSKKKKYLSIGFFILNIIIIAVILGYQISQSEDMSVSALFASGFSLPLIGLLFVVWIIINMLEAFRLNIFIKRSSGRARPFLSYKVGALGRYYDSITPMATGSQPFQIFYLTHRGLNAAAAISVPMGRFVVNQLCVLVLWTIVLILSFSTNLGMAFDYLKVICIIGYIINLFLILLVVFLSVSEKTGKKLVVWSLKLLQKMKIIKNYEKQYNRVLKVVIDFQSTIRNLVKSKGTFLLLMLSSVLFNLLNYSIPFLVYSAMIGYLDFSMWAYIIMLGVLIDMASSFMPLPGGSGVSELSFAALFTTVFVSSATLTWALIIWKFMTYYIYLIQGLIVLSYDKFIGDKKYKWLNKKWALEQESMNFKQTKLHEFVQDRQGKKKKLII